ncbi:hypothetical protein RC1_3574 [Rhodospirillum centenum SW]|uniref:Uncharacterized protein n=1 Tax=Rhodospirillum centenum (strain ATCC 51521 / SW) TaxID=414684 RepID=B6IXA3_RHOCS|nr:hypothetical protein RC1_3574 [Rhodospirillum centenum SW]
MRQYPLPRWPRCRGRAGRGLSPGAEPPTNGTSPPDGPP